MKERMKKVLSLVLVAATVATVSIGGTMAYLTQEAGDEKNVFAVGNIDVSLDEEVDIFGEGGEVKETEDGAEYIEIMPGDYLKKEVTVTNNGKTDAYVAVTVTLNNADKINAAIDDVYETKGLSVDEIQAMYEFIFDGWGINYNPRPGAYEISDARGVIDGVYGLPEHVLHVDFAKTTSSSTLIGAGNWFVAGNENAGQYWVDNSRGEGKTDNGYYTKDMEDYEICYTYYMLLPAGEYSTLFKGLNVPAEFDADQLAMFDGLEINVEAKAIQADNMGVAEEYKDDENGKAKTAFAVLAGEIDAEELNVNNKPSGSITYGYTSADRIWGEASGNAKESFVIKVYSGDTYMGQSALKASSNLIDGNIELVTWNLKLSGTSDYWDISWEKAPTVNLFPTTVELWVDGEKVDENSVKLSGADDLNKIGGVVVDAEGKILRYVVEGSDANLTDGETYVGFISNNIELSTAITNSTTSVILKEGIYNMPTSAQGKNLTFTGAGADTVIKVVPAGQGEANGQLDYNLDGSTVTFNNLTIKTNNQTYAGYARLNATYNNCTFENQYCLNGNSTFNNCTLNVSGDVYNIWTWGAAVATFNGCTFNSDGKAILLYGTVDTTLTIENCTFNDKGGLTDLKAAIEIGNDYGKSYKLIVKNTTVNGYEINDKGINTGTTLWANKNSMGTDELNVVVDGVDVY